MNLQEKAKALSKRNNISEQKALHLAREQERYKYDILQPDNPMFEKVYGNKLKKEKRIREQQEDKAKGEWQDSHEQGRH